MSKLSNVGGRMAHETPPQWDRTVGRRLRQGQATALTELYDRFASLAYSIAQRVLDDEDAAAQVTLDVFRRIWEFPEEFDPEHGPIRSWIAAEAHQQALAHLCALGDIDGDDVPGHRDRVRAASTAARADYIVSAMPAPLRHALELARFQRKGYDRVAADLGVTGDEACRRLRLGLQLLATASDYPMDPTGHRGKGDMGE